MSKWCKEENGIRSRDTKRRSRLGDDIRAVNQLAYVLAESSELGHRALEVGHHQSLVVDHALPRASRALLEGVPMSFEDFCKGRGTYRVTRERKVGLETHLAGGRDGRKHLSTRRAAVQAEGEADTLEQDLEEDLSVERERCAVEGNSLVSGDERVRAGDGVRCKQVDELLR